MSRRWLDNARPFSCYADDVWTAKVPPAKISYPHYLPFAMTSFTHAFTFQNPTTINFGLDTASGIADLVAELGGTKAFVVTDEALVQHQVVDPVVESLRSGGYNPVIFKDVPPDSDMECVVRAIEDAKSQGCDIVIGVGGGSVIDTAKVVNIGLCNEGDLRDHEGINCLTARLKPMILVPTTSGTGSEVSAVAMIRDRENGKKLLFGSRFLSADIALLDPRLLVTLPPKLTAATGMDAVTHCLESFVSATANSVSDSLALEAGTLLFSFLPRATADGDDLEARSSTLLASCMAGLAFTNAGVGVVHALAHSLGGKYGTHHGLTNAVLLPFGVRFNTATVAGRYARFWRHLAGNSMTQNIGYTSLVYDSTISDQQAAAALVVAVEELMKMCRLPTSLRELGIPEFTEAVLLELAEVAITDPAIMFNPGDVSVENLVEILREAF